MHKHLFLAALIAGIVLAGFAWAIPNPAPVYCTEMGYTAEGENCVFDDGNSCGQWDFYNGVCGSEYVNEQPCTEKGESNLPGHECCEGLTAISPLSSAPDIEGICSYATGAWSVCASCGDGVCDTDLENRCNCSEDCEIEEECTTNEGCQGSICPMVVGGDTAKCDSYTGECYCGGVCGDNYCDYFEKEYETCPQDCEEEDRCAHADVDGDGRVTDIDAEIVRDYYGREDCSAANEWCDGTDVDRDGIVNVMDKAVMRLCIEEEEECICPTLWAPVCGVNSRTYSNSCIAACEGVEIAYEGECSPEKIKVELGERFELKEKQTALLLENGEWTGISVKLLHIDYPVCPAGATCGMPSVKLEVSKQEGNTAVATSLYLNMGQSAEVFGVTIENRDIEYSSAVFLAEKETGPDEIRVNLGEKFRLLEEQTAHVLKGKEEVMKVNFDGVVKLDKCVARERKTVQTNVQATEAVTATSAGSTVTVATRSADSDGSGGGPGCVTERHVQLHVSLASGGVHYFSMRPGQTKQLGNYKVSLLSLDIMESYPEQYAVNLLVEGTSEPETIIAYLGRPFNLLEKQKAIVKETRLQLRLVNLYEGVAVVEVWSPITPSTLSGGGGGFGVVAKTAATEGAEAVVSEAVKAEIVQDVEEKVVKEKMIYRPYIKLSVGETESIYGHTVKLNGIATANCEPTANCVGASGMANLTVDRETEPDIKWVNLNERFDLVAEQTAIVLDNTKRTLYEAMRIKLLGIAYPTCEDTEDGEKLCEARPVAKVSVQLPQTCSQGQECTSTSTIMVLREGEERMVGGYTLRLLDISGEKAWFIVKKAVSDIIKVRLNEQFKLQEKQTALVVGEGVYLRLEGIMLVKCEAEEEKCVGGSYAQISVWKHSVNEEEPSRALYTIREGGRLKLYGLRISLLELDSGSAQFIVEKGTEQVINVHVGEPFKLREGQAARVLEANMRIDLLNILLPECEAGGECLGAPSMVEISVSNYLFAKEQTGKEVAQTEFLGTVVGEAAAESTASAGEEAESGVSVVPVPPMPFKVYTLAAGESVTVNDFVITVLDIGYNSAEFIVKKRGSDVGVAFKVYNGWNLFSLPGELQVIEAEGCSASRFKLFEYLGKESGFHAVEKPEEGKAYWMYNPGESCTVKAVVREAVTIDEIDPLVPAWNFAPVTVDMIGSKVRDLASECGLKVAFFYNAAGRNWQNAMDREISESDLGKAFALYVTSACRLGGAETEPMPPMPSTEG